ncbi:hypothetical protein VB620_07625 [Nodularia harveyana UHCC-0300]|uniref:Uncharacterized protein n=1 Tax=Nodularia harveyana UHCC-0300 TaxID=2974287 RepID=A0ABU5UCD7_9CYAN|nr:hypothetical protein [Nodularia harveyana]MEA5581207.1 hypothetical protein [Nodularia harveyana UHCC-0300]
MVERPIKKSERQSPAVTGDSSENGDALSPVQSDRKSLKPVGRRSSDSGKKSSFKDEARQNVNPALARGPKPVKVQPVIETEPETESEPIADDTQE